MRSQTAYIAFAAAINFCVAGTASTLIFWIPQVAHEQLGIGLSEIGRALAPLFLVGIASAYPLSRWSDRAANRYPFILVWCAISLAMLAAERSFSTAFEIVQAIELVAGLANVILIACNMRDGIRMVKKRNERQPNADRAART